LPLYTG